MLAHIHRGSEFLICSPVLEKYLYRNTSGYGDQISGFAREIATLMKLGYKITSVGGGLSMVHHCPNELTNLSLLDVILTTEEFQLQYDKAVNEVLAVPHDTISYTSTKTLLEKLGLPLSDLSGKTKSQELTAHNPILIGMGERDQGFLQYNIVNNADTTTLVIIANIDDDVTFISNLAADVGCTTEVSNNSTIMMLDKNSMKLIESLAKTTVDRIRMPSEAILQKLNGTMKSGSDFFVARVDNLEFRQ